MGHLSDHASNACIYTSYAGVLIIGLAAVWYGKGKGQFLAGNRTKAALPLVMNFVASGLGVGILSTYPQIAAMAGIHGLFVYSLCGAVPFLLFGALGPIIRRQMPDAFILTEWIRYRYGVVAALVVSCCTILTIFLFMVSELSGLKTCIETLTNVPGLPVLIVEAVLVSIYTSMGGFFVSFLTDNLQVIVFLVLLVVCIIAVGCTVTIDPSTVGPSKLLEENKLGWKLVYILFVAIVTNDCFMSGFWLRTFAARTNKDLYIASVITAIVVFLICAVLGVPGLLAVWGKLLDPNSSTFSTESAGAFYVLVHALPSWISGFVLVFVVFISSCTFDSLQSALVSTISNDFARNRVRIVWIRLFVLATMAPCIVVALKATNILNIYLIVDVLSSCVIPVLFLGLSKYFWFLTGFEIVLSVIGGIIGVFLFGLVYYHSASGGGVLLIMQQDDGNGIYSNDWGAFGAFVAAPVCSVIGSLVALAIRFVVLGIYHRRIWAVFDKPTNGLHFHKPLDEHLFTLANPWYTYLPWESFFRKVDYWFFVQGEVDAEKVNSGAIVPDEPVRDYAGSDNNKSDVTTSEKPVPALLP